MHCHPCFFWPWVPSTEWLSSLKREKTGCFLVSKLNCLHAGFEELQCPCVMSAGERAWRGMQRGSPPSSNSKSLALCCFQHTMTLPSSSLSHGPLGWLWTPCCRGDFGYIVETLALNAKTLLQEREGGREPPWGRAPFGGGHLFRVLLLKQGGPDESSKGGGVGDFSLSGSP